MEDSEYIVLEKFVQSSPLDNSQLWNLIGHKAPNYYNNHSIGDTAINHLLDYKFIKIFWADPGAGVAQYAITDLGNEVYKSENFKRNDRDEKAYLERMLLKSGVNSNFLSPLFAGMAALFAIVSAFLTYLQYSEAKKGLPPEILKINTVLQQQEQWLDSLQRTSRNAEHHLQTILDSLRRK